MRYLGNKTRLINNIHSVIEKYNITGEIFCDLFSGTGSVCESFKDKYEIIANDFMYYSYVITSAKLQNSSIPSFEVFSNKYGTNDIFSWINKYSDKNLIDNGFIYNNYTPKGGRMFFTEYNGKKIDTIRLLIEKLYKEESLLAKEYYFLLASLIDNVMSISNTSGTYEAFFKFWDSRAISNFVFSPLELLCSDRLCRSSIYRENSNNLIRKIKGDILYLDTPYTVTQYASAYNILETIALNDTPVIKGVAGKRGKGECVSLYCRKKEALSQFEDLFRQAHFHHILVSYSNQGVVPLEDLVSLAKKFAKDGIVEVEYLDYREYQNHRSSNKRNGQSLKEVLIYFQKDNDIIKSPLNYFGSKDLQFDKMQKFFPKHISTFLDVMGGAFNVGANTIAMDKIIYNDINPHVYNVISWLLTTRKEDIVFETEEVIKEYGLTKGGKDAYINLRTFYNEFSNSPKHLFVLHMYAFQNLIRFNGKNQMNTPVGIAGYSSDLKSRILGFNPKTENIVLWQKDFREIDYEQFDKDSFFYFDPPYLITLAGYNDGKRGLKGWDINLEKELLQILLNLHRKGYKFMLSNIISHKGKQHTLLIDWIRQNGFVVHEIGTTGWRYSKNEVVITNY